MNTSIEIKFAESDDDLNQILELQNSNHRDSISVDDKMANGFVTVKHNLDLLRQMNHAAKQIIAKHNGKVVGYALVMLTDFRKMIPVLTPMFDMFDSLTYKNKALNTYNYYVMGQICISEDYRGQGIFNDLYLKHKEAYADTFELCLTEVSFDNQRSMKAHERVGFESIHTFKDATDHWNILLWNLRD